MKNVLLSLVLVLGLSGISQARTLPTFKVCAEQANNGWILYGIPSSTHVVWDTRETVGPLIGNGNCQEGWSEEDKVDFRLSSEMPRKFCPSVHSWTLVSPEGVAVQGATSPVYPCRVAPKETGGKPLGSRGKVKATKTGDGSDTGSDDGTDTDTDTDTGTDTGTDTDTDTGTGSDDGSGGNPCGGNCGNGNGNGGGNGTGNEGGGNDSHPHR